MSLAAMRDALAALKRVRPQVQGAIPIIDVEASIASLERAIAEAEAPKAEADGWVVVSGGYMRGVFATKTAADNYATGPYSDTHARVARPFRFVDGGDAPKAKPVALSDAEILALWQSPLDCGVQRPILGKTKILAFARALLARAKEAPR